MPAAIAVPAIIGAAGVGAQVIGAKKASDASQQAAATQTAAANRAADLQYKAQQDALRFMREESAQQRADQGPYRALGAGAVNSLAHLAGIPMGGGGPMGGDAPSMRPQGPAPSMTTMQAVGAPRGGMDLVTVQAPPSADGTPGETRQVPREKVGLYLSQGARMIGGGGGAAPMPDQRMATPL